jgi:hypothetical protein
MFGPKDSINTDVFADLEGQKHGIYDVFALGIKNHGIYLQCFCAPPPSKKH